MRPKRTSALIPEPRRYGPDAGYRSRASTELSNHMDKLPGKIKEHLKDSFTEEKKYNILNKWVPMPNNANYNESSAVHLTRLIYSPFAKRKMIKEFYKSKETLEFLTTQP